MSKLNTLLNYFTSPKGGSTKAKDDSPGSGSRPLARSKSATPKREGRKKGLPKLFSLPRVPASTFVFTLWMIFLAQMRLSHLSLSLSLPDDCQGRFYLESPSFPLARRMPFVLAYALAWPVPNIANLYPSLHSAL
jgi:hypothetical protein